MVDISTTWPIAMNTLSTSMVNSEPRIGMGRLRPLSSGSPSSILTHSIPVSVPSLPRNRVGVTRYARLTPSCSVSSISHFGSAGISALERRYMMVTSCAPRRNAERAVSRAAFPPPTTTTLLPNRVSLPRFMSRKKSTACHTPSKSSPGMPRLRPFCAPHAKKMAL